MATSGPDILTRLDEKEILIFKHMADGLRTSEISKMLNLSYHETAEICKLVKEKLAVSDLSELKNVAAQAGLQKNNS